MQKPHGDNYAFESFLRKTDWGKASLNIAEDSRVTKLIVTLKG